MSSLWLRNERRTVRSQYGEDGVIDAILGRVGAKHRVCVEFGAWDGEHLSNCWHLIHDLGWQGVMIEGDAERFATLTRRATEIGNVVPINAFVGTSGPRSLQAILASAGIPEDFDLLSIDIDNDDYFVWEALGDSFKPRIVLIEVNSTLGRSVRKVAVKGARTWTAASGTSFASMVQLGKAMGYELALHTGNCIFVRRELAPLLGIEAEGWPDLFDPAFEGGRPLRVKLRTAVGDLVHRRVSLANLFRLTS